ncbi:NADH-quinone oxidoreductase subunit K [Myxococcota bacterium]|nr:NADH-quinone oxidoreductase subunit K [Myxococcota bacterium]MBU1535993.1 NADH-quinone oxidoreductase subunit K [Myxococcota bacterium]
MEYVALATGLILVILGLYGIVAQRNIFRIIIGFSIFDTGLHVVLVSIAYLKNRTAPILDEAVSKGEAASKIVDPVPQALVLTAIVIGVAITALMLTFALKMYEKRKTLDIEKFEDLKW